VFKLENKSDANNYKLGATKDWLAIALGQYYLSFSKQSISNTWLKQFNYIINLAVDC